MQSPLLSFPPSSVNFIPDSKLTTNENNSNLRDSETGPTNLNHNINNNPWSSSPLSASTPSSSFAHVAAQYSQEQRRVLLPSSSPFTPSFHVRPLRPLPPTTPFSDNPAPTVRKPIPTARTYHRARGATSPYYRRFPQSATSPTSIPLPDSPYRTVIAGLETSRLTPIPAIISIMNTVSPAPSSAPEVPHTESDVEIELDTTDETEVKVEPMDVEVKKQQDDDDHLPRFTNNSDDAPNLSFKAMNPRAMSPFETSSRPSSRPTSPASGNLKKPVGPMSHSGRQRPPMFPNSPRRQRAVTADSLSPTTPAALRISHPPRTPAFYLQGYALVSPIGFPAVPITNRHFISPSSASGPFRGPGPSPTSQLRVPPTTTAIVPTLASRPKFPPFVKDSKPKEEAAILDSVPKAYVLKRLNEMASKYWTAPESTDCRLLVPLKKLRGNINPDGENGLFIVHSPTTARMPSHRPLTSPTASIPSAHSQQPGHSFWPPTPPIVRFGVPGMTQTSGFLNPTNPRAISSASRAAAGTAPRAGSAAPVLQRRGSAPGVTEIPGLAFPVHRDYLIPQSKLLRKVMCDDDIAPNDSSLKGARLIPSRENEATIIYLPIPDVESFGVILHWIYWGNTAIIEDALNRGVVSWQGMVMNIDYLDLDDKIKVTVGRWWRAWVRPNRDLSGDSNNPSRRGRGADDNDHRTDGDEKERAMHMRAWSFASSSPSLPSSSSLSSLEDDQGSQLPVFLDMNQEDERMEDDEDPGAEGDDETGDND